jgi:hypothetical protein
MKKRMHILSGTLETILKEAFGDKEESRAGRGRQGGVQQDMRNYPA